MDNFKIDLIIVSYFLTAKFMNKPGILREVDDSIECDGINGDGELVKFSRRAHRDSLFQVLEPECPHYYVWSDLNHPHYVLPRRHEGCDNTRDGEMMERKCPLVKVFLAKL